MLTVAKAAIFIDGVVYSVDRKVTCYECKGAKCESCRHRGWSPGRHHTVLRMMREKHGYERIRGEEQGFVLSDGTFATRERAYKVAKAAGQLHGTDTPSERLEKLFSEEVWGLWNLEEAESPIEEFDNK